MNEINRLQKKLIPVNIVVIVLSLVAALSILFAPLLSVDVGKITGEIVSTINSPDAGGESEGSGESDSENGVDISRIVGLLTKSTENLKLNVTVIGLYKFASGDGASQITGFVADIFTQIEADLFSTIVVAVLPQLIENYQPDSDINLDNIDVQAITSKLDAVFEAENDQEIDSAISDLVDELQKQAVTADGTQIIKDDMKDSVSEYIRKFYDDTSEAVEGDITLENFICVTISEIMNGAESNPDGNGQGFTPVALAETEGENNNGGEIYTTYEELISGLLGEGGDSENALDSLNSSLNSVLPYFKYVSFAMIGFAGVWLVLSIFALVRIFTKNKRFTMWYVKLLGFYPCLIFGVLPIAAGSLVSALVPAEAGINVAAILGAISSLTWISGGCYLLLWIVSIFWAFPIKHKIRKLRKSVKA